MWHRLSRIYVLYEVGSIWCEVMVFIHFIILKGGYLRTLQDMQRMFHDLTLNNISNFMTIITWNRNTLTNTKS